MLKLSLLSIFALFLFDSSGISDGKECPKVEPVCKCPLVERCTCDKNCTGGQKCCLDCCGGHRCIDPVDEEEEKCNKPHEEYTECGSHCPPTCANRFPGPCILVCKPGCFCKAGYLKNKNGLCVPIEKCYDE